MSDNCSQVRSNASTLIGKKRHFFSIEEDELLKNVVESVGFNWKIAAQTLGNVTPRQCRDRYQLYLAPHIKPRKWTSEEDVLLINKYMEIGPRWKEISQFFDGRTDNMVKNRWYEALSKKVVKNTCDTDSIFGITPSLFEALVLSQVSE